MTVDGQSFRITERWSPASKLLFRDFFRDYYSKLGMTVNEIPFAVPNLVGETEGHTIEAVLPGASKDSLVIIAHYDTVGVAGHETENPGADDAGTGLAAMMEAARIFASQSERPATIRFVAADYEEITGDLAGDTAYVEYIQALAAREGFAVIAAANNDMTGWNCGSEGLCTAGAPPPASAFWIITCRADGMPTMDDAIAAKMADTLSAINSPLSVTPWCDPYGLTDGSRFWLNGIPSFVVLEYDSLENPHFDHTGDDTVQHVDVDYWHHIAEASIAMQARIAGIAK